MEAVVVVVVVVIQLPFDIGVAGIWMVEEMEKPVAAIAFALVVNVASAVVLVIVYEVAALVVVDRGEGQVHWVNVHSHYT